MTAFLRSRRSLLAALLVLSVISMLLLRCSLSVGPLPLEGPATTASDVGLAPLSATSSVRSPSHVSTPLGAYVAPPEPFKTHLVTGVVQDIEGTACAGVGIEVDVRPSSTEVLIKLVTQTDHAGRFACEIRTGLTWSSVEVHCTASPQQDVVTQPATILCGLVEGMPCEVRLLGTRLRASVEGTISWSDGRAAQGAFVESAGRLLATTDSSGHFHVDVPAFDDPLQLHYGWSGPEAPQRREVRLTLDGGPSGFAPVHSVSLVLQSMRSVAIRVRDSQGMSVAGASARCNGATSAASAVGDVIRVMVPADADTSCEVIKVGYAVGRVLIDRAVQQADVVLEPLATSYGLVVDEQGRALASACVTITESDAVNAERAVVITNDLGEFVYSCRADGAPLFLRGLHASGRQGERSLPPRRAKGTVKLVLQPVHLLQGMVKTEAGDPLYGALVIATPVEQGGRTPTATTTADGRFRIELLRSTPHVLEVHKSGFATASYPARTGDEVQLVLTRAVELSGTLLTAAGAPVQGCTLALYSAEQPRQPLEVPRLLAGRADFRLSCSRVRPGEAVVLEALHPLHGRAELQLTLEAANVLGLVLRFP